MHIGKIHLSKQFKIKQGQALTATPKKCREL